MDTTKKHYIEYILPFFILFSQYKFGPVTLGTIILGVAALLVLYKNNFKLPIGREWKAFYPLIAFLVIRDCSKLIIGYDAFQTQVNRIIEYIVLFFLVIVVTSRGFDEEKLYKIWKIAGTIYIIGLMYHFILLYFWGRGIEPISIIPGYQLRGSGSVALTRPCSFFAEPASFVTAILPLEFMALRKNDLRVAMIATMSILLSTSTVGVVLSIVLWLMFLLQREVSKNIKVLMVVVAVVICALFLNLDYFSSTLAKLVDVASGGSTFGSRVQISFEVVKSLDITSLIFGTNYNEVYGYLHSTGVNLSVMDITRQYLYSSSGEVFLNTIGQLFFKYGIIGFILCIKPFLSLVKRDGYAAKPYVIMLIIGMFAQTMLLNPYYFLAIMIVNCYTQVET